jgi:hypothetical protein
MDTRRLSEPLQAAPRELADAAPRPEVEIVELTAVAPRRRALVPRVVFAIGIALLAGLIAWVGLPSRTSFAFDTPLPNILTATPAP